MLVRPLLQHLLSHWLFDRHSFLLLISRFFLSQTLALLQLLNWYFPHLVYLCLWSLQLPSYLVLLLKLAAWLGVQLWGWCARPWTFLKLVVGQAHVLPGNPLFAPKTCQRPPVRTHIQCTPLPNAALLHSRLSLRPPRHLLKQHIEARNKRFQK